MSGAKSKFTITSTCQTCGKEITDRVTRKYCNRSCAAITNGHLFPKRSPNGPRERPCSVCGTLFIPPRSDRARCRACLTFVKTIDKVTKDSSTEQAIRGHARRVMSTKERTCLVCGYSTYVEVCHLKPIRDFPPEATLQEINAEANLRFLCPNHHKEFDLGLLVVE